MSKTSQWIANSLFILSCLFLPWRNGGGHSIGAADFTGYYLPLMEPDGASLDSLVFVLQLILIGSILLWTETLLRSDLDTTKRRYVSITFGLAVLMILFPPFTISQTTVLGDGLYGSEGIFQGFGFLFTSVTEGIVAPRILVPQLIALFGLSTLAMKYHSRRIAARPMPAIHEEVAEITSQQSTEDTSGHWTDESIRFA